MPASFRKYWQKYSSDFCAKALFGFAIECHKSKLECETYKHVRQHLHERGFKSSRFMPLKPHRKRYGFKAFTRFQSHHFQVLTFCRSRSQALIIEEGDLGSSEISRQNSNRIQIDADSPFTRQIKPYHFENDPLLSAFSHRPGFGNGLDRRPVNGRCDLIESDAVTNETAFV